MNKIKKIVLPVIMAVFVAVSFSLAYLYYLTEVPDKQRSSLINDNYDTELSLQSGQEASGVFTLSGPIGAIGVKINVSDPWDEGTVSLTVSDCDSGAILADRTFSFAEISDTYTVTGLAATVDDYEEHNIKISVTADYPRPSYVSLSVRGSEEGNMTLDDKECGAVMPLLFANDRLGATPLKFYMFLGAFARVVCAAACVLLYFVKSKKGKAMVAFAAVLAMGVFYQIACPPFSAPDELSHYNSAYTISNRIMGNDTIIEKRVTDIQPQFTDYNTTAYTYKYISNHIFDRTDRSDLAMVRFDEEYLGGYQAPRIVSALGITLCRLLKLNGILTAYIVRFLNLAVYSAVVAMAFYLMPVAREGMLAVSVLPISLHMGGSFSYDSQIISLAFLLLALCLNCKYSETLSSKKVFALGLVCFLIAPLKSAYFLLPLAILLIPKEKLTGRLKYAKPVIIIVSFRHFLYYNFWQAVFVQPFLKVKVGTTAPRAAATSTTRRVVRTFSVRYMLKHPMKFITLAINTFFRYFTDYVADLFGGTLGYVSIAQIKINPVIIAGFALLVIVGFIKNDSDTIRLKTVDKFVPSAIAFATFAAIVCACIMWTPTNYDFLWGFQSRYILPVLPMVLLWLNSDKLQKKADSFGFTVCASLLLNSLAVINAMVVIF